jgi:tetratricopeptide (TPR) repeat protein
LRDFFPASEPEALAYHFTRAGLTEAAIEWWSKAGDQALRRSAFKEAISHLGKAIDMADKIGSNLEPRAAANAVSATQRLKLQTSYGQALMWGRGFSSEESEAAFTQAEGLAAKAESADERFDAYYGLWLGRISRGDLRLARQAAETFQRDAEQTARLTELAVARRVLGTTCFAQGDFTEALVNLEEAIRIYDPARDRDAKFRFGNDIGAVATAYVAHAKWQFGELAQGRELIDQAVARAAEAAHAPTLAVVHHFKVHYDILCGDAAAALRGAAALLELSQEHGIALFSAMGAVSSAWARARLGDSEAVSELRQSVIAFTEQGNKLWVPIYEGLLAELEGEQGNTDEALGRIDAALTLAQKTGEHRADAPLHHIRGSILLKRDPGDAASAEKAFLAAVAIAQRQRARSFALRGSLALAKLYQSTNRDEDARATLAAALEGFLPTSDLPEIGHAQTLLQALASKTQQVLGGRLSRFGDD